MNSYPILRSGFVGLSSEGLVQPTAKSNAISSALLNKQSLELNSDYFYHEGIQDLFVKMIEGATSGVLNNVEFHEKMFLEAKEAFGTSNIWNWIAHQFSKGQITALHAQFLKETLNFVAGEKRRIEIFQWVRLLEANSNTGVVITQTSNEYMTLSELYKNKRVPAKLSELFLEWVRKDNGLYDLMYSLEVIFGNRRLLRKST